MKIVEFRDMLEPEWDAYIKEIHETTFMHSTWYINYLNAGNKDRGSKSFMVFEGNTPIAVCPLSVFKVNNFGREYMEATFRGFPSIYPAIIKLPPTQRRRVVRKIFNLIEERLNPDEVKKIEFYRHPVNLNFLNGNREFSNATEAISCGYLCEVKNSIIVDLKKDENLLMEEMSQYQRKHIRKSEKQGLVIKEYRGQDETTDRIFCDFQSAHFKSAGRLTRPLESWGIMKGLLMDNRASLFTASIEGDVDISYLFCGEFDKFSFGWSQVNIDEYQEKYSPRHLLEWEAIAAYKKRGFCYYELGVKQDSYNLMCIPNQKERTITQLKERYGGELYCWFRFEKIFDTDLFRFIYKDRLDNFLASDYFLTNRQ